MRSNSRNNGFCRASALSNLMVVGVILVVIACAAGPHQISESTREITVGESYDTIAFLGGTPTSSAPVNDEERSSVAATSSGAHRPAPTRHSGADPILVRGRELYAKYCAICHGDNGDGAGKFAYLMNPCPHDFRQGKFKLSTTQNEIPTDDDLRRTGERRGRDAGR